MHTLRDQFKGIYPAPITPYARNGRVAEQAYRKVLESNIQAGVHGFWVAGGTGEGVYPSEDERIRLGEISANQARGRVKVILHVGSMTTKSAVRIAKGAKSTGVDAIASVPPLFYHPSEQALVDFYKALGEATDLPLFLYNWPDASGTELKLPLVERLAREVPTLAGVKHSMVDLYKLRDFVKMGLATFTGESGLLLPAMTFGAVGTVDGPPNIWPEPFVETYDAYVKGDLRRAEQAQELGTQFVMLIWSPPFVDCYHASYKALLGARLGIDCGRPRPPLALMPRRLRTRLVQEARKLGLLP